MTGHEYKQLLASSSASTRKLNPTPDGAGKVAQLECGLGDAPLATGKVQKTTRGRFLVCVKSYRCRLLDEDNLAEKYHVDLCRYAGALPSDDPSQTQIEVSQIKTRKGEPERVEIEVWKLI